MKMSDEFNLPVKISEHEYKPTWYVLDVDDVLVCSVLDESEARSVVRAINHHDELVRLLDSLIDDFMPWDDQNRCKSCQRKQHQDNCDYMSANELLNTINKES